MGEPHDSARRGSFAPPDAPTPSAASLGDDNPGQRPKRARRTFLTQNACQRCRQKKSKCDGRRPVCDRCEKHGAECVYDVAQEGLTRMQNLQQQLDIRTADYRNLQTMFNTLQQGTNHEATTLLARLRLGASVDDLLQFAGLSPSSASPTTTRDGSLQSHSSQAAQHQRYTQAWSDNQMVEQGNWAPWQEVAEGSNISQSSEPIREDSRSASMLGGQEYYDTGQPASHPFAPGGAMPPHDLPTRALQWHGNVAMPAPEVSMTHYDYGDASAGEAESSATGQRRDHRPPQDPQRDPSTPRQRRP